MKKISILFLLLLASSSFAVETGPADSVLRIPAAGGRPRYGAIDLSKSAAVGSTKLSRANIATGTAYGVVVNDSSGALTSIAPCTSGYVLTSNGTNWACSVLPTATTVTAAVAYTPTLTGFGSGGTAPTSVSFFSWRIGDRLYIHGYFVSGTSTAVPAQISLGYAGSNANVTVDSAKIGASVVPLDGKIESGVSSTTYFGCFPLSNGAVTYVNVGCRASTADPFGPANGSFFVSNGQKVSVSLSVPIQGWTTTN